MLRRTLLFVVVTATSVVEAAEICGNGADDDSDGFADEGCAPSLVTGVCESPLSCADIGMIAPKTGALHYSLEPDVSPRVPFGPGIGLRRFYISQYAPGGGAPAYRKPMGDRWHHTYMSWLDSVQATRVVVHNSRGQDVYFAYSHDEVDGGATWEVYTPQLGFKDKYKKIRQRRTTPNEFQLKTMTGETIVYDSAGKMTEIWDSLQSAPNKVLVAYDGSGMVSTVTDASNKRRLLFAYTSSLLSSVQYQINTGSWTTQHTTSYAYTSGNLTSVTIGGQLAHSNAYTSSYLTSISDGAGNNIVTFSYDSTTPGKTVRVDTSRGMVGLEYNSARANCSSKTVLYFNRGNTSSCNADADCGSGFLCGGKTGTGSTGVCFRAGRCMTVDSPNEDLVTTISAIGPPGETCDGTCLDVAQYIWSSDTGTLDVGALQSPALSYTTRSFNANGLPTHVVYGDNDSSASNGFGSGGRESFMFYDPDFPALVTEERHQNSPELWPGNACTASDATFCARTILTYDRDNAKLETVTSTGVTLGFIGTISYSSTTTFDQDTKGRLTLITGPSPELAKTELIYFSGTGDSLKDDFLDTIRRYKDSTNYLTEKSAVYDFWGNPTTLLDPNNVPTCLQFDAARGYLSSRRQTMAGQTNCTTPNSADLTTTFLRDSALRLTKLTRPDGSCMVYEYDTKGRLATSKRRDDCNAASSGDRESYTYSPDSLLTKIETFDSASVVTKRKEMTYFDSRRLEKLVNPVDTSKWTGFGYDSFGLVSEILGGGSLSKTQFERAGTEPRVTTEKRYTSASTFDSWNLLYDWIGSQKKVTDGDNKITLSDRDDLGRRVRLTNPDLGGFPTQHLYNELGRLFQIREAYGGTGQQNHSLSYDYLGRQTSFDYHPICAGAAWRGVGDIEYAYDTPPVTCPVGSSCQKTTGRLAYAKVTLFCDAAKADKTLDQETWYSYDDAGRVIREHIRDDNGRIADLQFEYTKNGALSKTTTPSAAVIGATFGSAGSNSDTDRITAVWRTSTGTPVIDNVLWSPYGPLKQYNMQLKVGNAFQRTRITRNLAYRITQLRLEKQNGTAPNHTVDISEDAAGRVTLRNYDPNTNGVQDSWFVYDHQDRVLCERTTSGSSCPTDGTNTKNSHSQAPAFTAAGDWKRDLRPIAGSTCMINDFALTTGTHQLASVSQPTGIPTSCTPALGTTTIGHDTRGDRSYDDNTSGLTNDRRDYAYDGRRNVINVRGQYFTAGAWATYDVASAFDHKNRRVFKSFLNNTTGKLATWFFYYDNRDRLVEMVYTPDTSVLTTYSVFQLFWLDDRLTLYWQTDYPSVTTTRRYVQTDEINRPIDMWSWPASGNGSRVWAVNPRAWGMDSNGVGPSIFQPMLFAAQYQDVETAALQNDGATIHRPGLALNGYRTYDAFTGSYLQVEPAVESTWSTYVYALSDPVGATDPSGFAVCRPEGIGCTEEPLGDTIGIGGCSAFCYGACWLAGWSPWCDCASCGGSSTPEQCPSSCWGLTMAGEHCIVPNRPDCGCESAPRCEATPDNTPPPPEPPKPPAQPQHPLGQYGGANSIVCGLQHIGSIAIAAAATASCISDSKWGTCLLGAGGGSFVAGEIILGLIGQCNTDPSPCPPKMHQGFDKNGAFGCIPD